MWKSLSPTLLALALGSVLPLAAATVEERDRMAEAVITFVDGDMRLPAKRWLDQWTAAKFSDDGQWIEKALWYRYADRFADSASKAEADELRKRLDTLRSEIEKATEAKRLPEAARAIALGSGSALERIRRQIIPLMDPNLPPPVAPLAADKKAELQRLIDRLLEQAASEFAGLAAKVKAHVDGPEKQRWDLKEDDPRAAQIDAEAVKLRAEALQPLMTAYPIARDTAARADAFGIKPDSAKAWLDKIAKANVEAFTKWDFEYGTSNPYLHLHCQIWLSEAYIRGVRDITGTDVSLRASDVEAGLKTSIYIDASQFEPGFRTEVYLLRLHAADHFLRWCNDGILAKDKGMAERGKTFWGEFLQLAKQDPVFQLAKTPRGTAIDLGFLYFAAARFFQSAGDSGTATSLVAEVSGAQNLPSALRDYAKRWMVGLSGSGAAAQSAGGAAGWAQSAVPENPESALLVARELSRAANDPNADVKAVRSNRLAAAIKLRSAVLALDSAEPAVFAAQAPGVYSLYADLLGQLDLRQHAALAGVAALDRLADFLDAQAKAKRPNTWQTTDGGKDWRSVLILARNTYSRAQSLYARNKAFGPVAEMARALLTKLDPSASGPSLAMQEIQQQTYERKYDEAIASCAEFLKTYPAAKYPSEELAVFAMLTSARLGLIDQALAANQKDRATQVSNDLDRDNQAMQQRITDELAKTGIAPERKLELEQTRSTLITADIARLMRDQQFDEVITRLGNGFWKRPPTDPALAASMLNKLCYAAYSKITAQLKDKDKPAVETVLATGDQLTQAHDTYVKQAKRLAGRNVDRELAAGAKALAGAMQNLGTLARRANPSGKDAKLSDLADTAGRHFADLYEPLVDSKTPTGVVWLIASTLWNAGEHPRAAKLFERYRDLLVQDDELQAFKKDGKAVLDGYAAKISIRPEFKDAWTEIADYAWDSPEFIEALKANKADPKQKAINYRKAMRLLDDFRKSKVAKAQSSMEKQAFADLGKAIDDLKRLLGAADYDLQVTANLAAAYREAGDLEKALPLLLSLYERDPSDPDNKSGFVEATLNAVKNGQINPKDPKGLDQLIKARTIVAGVRQGLEQNPTKRDNYWRAYIQVLELTAALGETSKVDETLKFLRVNRSDLSRELISAPVEITTSEGKSVRDDAQARRPRNAQAVQLAQRFLGLYKLVGLTEKPTFRIVPMEGLEPPMVFSDLDAPAFTLTTVKDDNLVDTVVITPATAAKP
jgi:hypothetical protein